MAKILVVDDDPGIRDIVANVLEEYNHTVESLDNGGEAVGWLRAYQYDLIILDWQLPGQSGVEICEQFRNAGGQTPVLMLTGKGQIDEKELGYGSGVDDYLTKPFHVKELVLRVNALLKRIPEIRHKKSCIKGWVLDDLNYTVSREGETVQLTRREWQLLDFLFRRPNQYFDSDTLLNRVWETDSEATSEALRTCIKRLRKKLDKPNEDSIIVSVKGLGYMISEQGGDSSE